MIHSKNFAISSFWGPRAETFDQVLNKSRTILSRIGRLDSSLTEWYQPQPTEEYTEVFGPSVDLLENAVELSRGDHPALGYSMYLRTETGVAGPRTFSFNCAVGCLDYNRAVLSTQGWHDVDRSLVTARIFKSAILAMAECFDVERAYAFPSALTDHWKPQHNAHPAFPIAWMSYVARRATHLVTPPATAIVERRPDGGLLMAATDETFDVDNPAHMAVARDIEAATAPLHCHPWLPEDIAA